MRRLLSLCLLAGLARPCGTETVASRPLPPPRHGHRVLFIGNSLTYENLFPAGEAWRAARRLDPEAPLYGTDGYHPAPAGSYLAALTVFCVLFNRGPAGLPSKLTLHTGATLAVPDALAPTLQQAAAEAVERFAR